MYKCSKKRIILQMVLFFFFGLESRAQEPEEKPPESSIYCAELSLEIVGFETIHPSFIRICCGGLFQEGLSPCRLLTKTSYEQFTGQAEGVFILKNQAFPISELVIEPKRKKFSKVVQVEVIDSSELLLNNGIKARIKKGIYALDNDKNIMLEVEYLNK